MAENETKQSGNTFLVVFDHQWAAFKLVPRNDPACIDRTFFTEPPKSCKMGLHELGRRFYV